MSHRVALLVCLAVLSGAAQDPFQPYYRRQAAEASRHHDAKEYAKAAAILEELRARPELRTIEEDFANVTYSLACAYSLGAQKDKALTLLREVAAMEMLSSSSLKGDTDFDPIREDDGFRKILADVQTQERPRELLWNSPAWQTPFREDLPVEQKIAGLSKLWAEAKYNYAFFYRMGGLDWDALYISYLPKVQAAKNTMEYYNILAEFCSRLKDGHTNVNYPRELGRQLGWPAILTKFVEGKVYVDAVRDPALRDKGIARGLEIVAIDGMPTREYGNRHVAPRLGASTGQDLEVRTFENSLLGGPLDKPVALALRGEDGRESSVNLPRLSQADQNKLPRQEWKRFEHKVMAGNISYVALRTFGNDAIVKDWEAAYGDIRKSDGLILDVRENGGGSSNTGWEILRYLTDKAFQGTQWRTRLYRPAFRAWGLPERWHTGSPQEMLGRSTGTYTKPVIVLTSPHTYSAAEDFAAVFDAMKRGKIIGEPTGGSTGQPLSFSLPGGGSARICTKHDRYADGTEFVGTGIQPDVLVRQALADFRSGRDTVLEAALAELRK